MSSRAAPPIVPTFGDANQHFTVFFDNGASKKKLSTELKEEDGQIGKESNRQQNKTTLNKPFCNSTTNDTTDHISNHPKDRSTLEGRKHTINSQYGMSNKNHIDGGNTTPSSPYKGRLGNRPNLIPEKQVRDQTRQHGRLGSTNKSPHSDHANALEFGSWETDPNVAITEAFDRRLQNKGKQTLLSPTPQQASSTHKNRTAHVKRPSWWSSFSFKKWLKRLFRRTH